MIDIFASICLVLFEIFLTLCRVLFRSFEWNGNSNQKGDMVV